MHWEILSIERIEIIQDLRNGEYDVLVGVTCCGKVLICQKSPWW